MRPVILFSLLLLAGAAYSFDVSDYLYANETNASVSKEFFTLNHSVYYIMNISKEPTFLVKEDELVLNKSEMTAVLKEYYTQKYALSPNETASLETDFLTFNASRNNGGRFKGQEEFACRKALFLHMFPCTNASSCLRTATFACAAYADATGCGDPDMFLQPIKDFTNGSDTIEITMARIFYLFGSMNSENTISSIEEMKADVPALKDAKGRIESTMFRIPSVGESCSKCYGLCPDLDLDDAALTRAEGKLNNLSAKVAPLANYPSLVNKIYSNTEERLESDENEDSRLYYTGIYDTARLPAVTVKNRTSEVLAYVDNASIRSKLETVQAMELEIEQMIGSNNFTNLEDTIVEYSAMVKSLNESVAPLLGVYDNVSQASKEATVYIFLAEGKALGSEEAASLNTIKTKKLLLDQQFKPGLTSTQYADLKSNYSLLINESRALLSKGNPVQAFYMFAAGPSGKMVEGMGSLAMQVKPLTNSERAGLSAYVPLLGSSLFFLSFSSLVVFIFSVYYGLSPKPLNRMLLLVLSMLLVFLLALVAVSVYLALDKSTNRVEYSDFYSSVKLAGNVTILVQGDTVDETELGAMENCSAAVSRELAKSNISSKIYVVREGNCTAYFPPGTSATGLTQFPNCADKITTPLVFFNSSLVTSSAYSGLLLDQASFSGSNEYYRICAPAEAIRLYAQ
ncbi:MAG: hypothetical protein WC488_03570 [Candidatus Micrarchaeia archaeon]